MNTTNKSEGVSESPAELVMQCILFDQLDQFSMAG